MRNLVFLFLILSQPLFAEGDAVLTSLARRYAVSVEDVKSEIEFLLREFHSVTGPPRAGQWRSNVRVRNKLSFEQAAELFEYARVQNLSAKDLVARNEAINSTNLDGSIEIEDMVDRIVDPEGLKPFASAAQKLSLTPREAKTELSPLLTVHFTTGPPRVAVWRSNVRVRHPLNMAMALELLEFARERQLTTEQVARVARKVDDENLDDSMEFSDLKVRLSHMPTCEFLAAN